MLINVLVIIILILVVAYFLNDDFQTWIDELWKDTKDIVNNNETKRKEYSDKQKEKLKQLELQEQKLKDINQEKENEEKTEQFMKEYKTLEDEIERMKSQIKYNKLDAIETDLLELETQINTLELEKEEQERIKEECSAFDNEYTKTVTQSSGSCETTCNDYDLITKKKIEKENGICKVGNECYYSHHSWSDLHQACKYDYKLHVKATQGECKLIIDNVSYHITSSGIKIPLILFRGGVYNDDQSKWGFTYIIEPITTNKISNKLCLVQNQFKMKEITQSHLTSTIMMSRKKWDETTHIEWTIEHGLAP